MAYKKARQTKRNPYKKPVRYQVADMALHAWNGVKAIKKLINVEEKYQDNSLLVSSISTGTINGFNTIVQGGAQGQREGDSLKPQSFEVRGHLYNNAAAGSPGVVRLILFRGKNENGVGWTTTDILETASYNSPLSFDNRKRFTVLMDKKIVLNTNYATIASNFVSLNYSKALTGHIKYAAGTTTVEDGGLYLLSISDLAAGHQNRFIARLRWTDN